MYIVTCKTSIVHKYFTQQAMPLAPQWNLLSRLARSVQLKKCHDQVTWVHCHGDVYGIIREYYGISGIYIYYVYIYMYIYNYIYIYVYIYSIHIISTIIEGRMMYHDLPIGDDHQSIFIKLDSH